MRHGIGRLIWLAGTGVMMLGVGARADISGYWVDVNNWSVSTTSMADIDQIRAMKTGSPVVLGLPNSGKMYCVPTASMDCLTYLAAHGYPKIGPGVKNWQASAQYATMTSDLASLGTAMGTDAFKGTGGTGQVNGIKAWIGFDAVHAQDFTVNYIGATPANPNPIADAAKTLLQGAVATSVNGWYKWDAFNNAYVRSGGHAHGLSGATSVGLFSPATISIQDPNRDTTGNPFTQSPFTTDTYNLSTVAQDCGWLDNANNYHSSGHLQQMDNYGGFLDGVVVIRALQGMTADAANLILYTPVMLLGKSQAVATKFASPDGMNIASIAMDPTDTRHPFITAGGDALYEVETLTGKMFRVAPLTHGRQVIMGGADRSRFVLTDTQILKFGPTGELIGLCNLEFPLDKIAFDPQHHMIIAIRFRHIEETTNRHDITMFDENLLLPAVRYNLPDAEFMPGMGDIAVNPMTGEAFFHMDGAKFVRRLTKSSTDVGAMIPLKGTMRPVGLHVTEHGDFMVSDGGMMKIFMADGSVRPASKLKGMPANRLIDTLRSFDNIDPLMNDNPAFYNVLPLPR